WAARSSWTNRKTRARAVQSSGSACSRLARSEGYGRTVTGPVPRRVAALLGPAPSARGWPSAFTGAGLAVWGAAAGALVSAMSSANSAVTLFLPLHAATPL
ncbi:M56 family peptidase, partial [Streptomyces sp. NPDC004270]